MRLTLIAAVADNQVIGQDNALAWDMPADRRFFREQINHRVVVMGRRTYDSHHAEEPLPYRQAIVVTRDRRYQAAGAKVAHSLPEAYAIGRSLGESELYILGGGNLYQQAIADADRLLITEIHTHIEGDVHFPDIDPSQWHETNREAHPADADNPFAYTFVTYARRPSLA
jgi:dihydrofolate reductase